MPRFEPPFRRILDVRLTESGAEPSLRAALNEAGCAVTPFGMTSAKAALPDAFVVDLRGAEQPLALINRARQYAGATPVLIVTGPNPNPDIASAIARHGLVQVTSDVRPVVRALGRAVRSADMAREAGLRIAGLTALEHPLGQDHEPSADRRVALLASPGPLALETLYVLRPAFGCDGVLTRAQALRALEAGDAGALVIVAGQLRRDSAALIRLVRRQSVLRDVPILVVERRRTARHVAYWMRNGADACLLPEEGDLLEALIEGGLRRRAMNRRLTGLLARTVLSDTGAESRIVGSCLFDACLTERCRRGAAPFSIGAIRLTPPPNVPVEIAEPALSEAASYLSFGVGPEDLMARPAPDLFLFQVSGAEALGAERAMRELATLIGDLKFGDEDAFTTFDTRATAVAWRATDQPETLIARALRTLDAAARVRQPA
ncbi:hypothetical protein [Parvularcula dongshanensis]|uniref:Uncharacterized protein n=1 Tax=Parvularcula dongshanensis TaxID=1173995 RepID=A0A840I743_9PROT|nr:hypothetical protein [Parvularcula dongshanensis]MBB4659800.1 hypothetical protein [Parvularcula dongshanensis]